MKKQHHVTDVTFSDDQLVLKIDGDPYKFDLSEISKPLFEASEKERLSFEISPSGYGIHWNLIDEDLSIDGLLGVKHHPKRHAMNA